MSTNSTAALGLKKLRKQAGLSIRQLAAALRDSGSRRGRTSSSYVYYENEYKGTYLPADLVEALVPILRDRGTPPIGAQQVLVLGGAGYLWKIRPEFTEKPEFKSKIEIETDIFTEVVVGVGREAEASGLRLTPELQSQLVAEICRRISESDNARRPALVGWEIRHACRFAKALLQ